MGSSPTGTTTMPKVGSKRKLPVKYDDISSSERRLVREQYIAEQNGCCMWCKESLDSDPPKRITDKKIDLQLFPIGFLNHSIHLQHDHQTGLTEGAVHAYCNAVMWQFYGR